MPAQRYAVATDRPIPTLPRLTSPRQPSGVGVQHSTMVEVPDRRVVLRIGRDEFECLKSDRRGGAPMAHHELVQRFP